MNFEQLRIFLAVVEYKSFTKAAESMYISHSTTSRNVAALEEELGVRLLRRDNRSVHLTPAGEVLYREGQRLLKKVEAIETAVRDAALGRVGKLTVASMELRLSVLHTGLQEFCRQYPEVALGVYHRSAGEIWDQVLSGEADVGLTYSFALAPDQKDICLRLVSRERFCLVAPPEFAQGRARRPIQGQELHGITLIGVSGESQLGTEGLTEYIRQLRVRNETMMVPTLESLFLQVRSGNGVAILPQPLAREYAEDCTLVELEDLDESFHLVMIWRRDNHNPSIQRLANLWRGERA